VVLPRRSKTLPANAVRVPAAPCRGTLGALFGTSPLRKHRPVGRLTAATATMKTRSNMIDSPAGRPSSARLDAAVDLIVRGHVVPLMVCVAYLTLWERKLIGWMQSVSANRVGPLGLLQPIADG
jgi:hypothetical protein